LFKKSTGYSPLDYFLRIKMQRVAEMLATTTRPLKEISADAGFSDPLYFSRAFHRIYKVSPSAYRRTAKG
jgi:AraC-like DNA-binding protein